MNTQRKKLIVCVIMGLLVGLIFGYMIGVYSTIKTVAHIAGGFIDIDYELVEQAIMQYRGHIEYYYNGSL